MMCTLKPLVVTTQTLLNVVILPPADYTDSNRTSYSTFFYSKTNQMHRGKRVEYEFDVHRAMHRNIISIAKPTRCTNAQVCIM